MTQDAYEYDATICEAQGKGPGDSVHVVVTERE